MSATLAPSAPSLSAPPGSTPPGSVSLGAPVQGHIPTTFLERGVAVPFTTPLLAGARARPGDRSALELVVPNPSGGKGVYILSWDDIGGLCRPTIHDSRLSAAVSGLRTVTPSAIRASARDVAAEGFAGRGAVAAAKAAKEQAEQAQLLTNFDLLLELVRQVEPPGENPVPPERERPAELERRARRAVAGIAPQLGLSPETVAAGLEQLSELFGPIGIGSHSRNARLPMLIANVVQMRREVAAFQQSNPDDNVTEAELVVCVADLTTACAKATLLEAQALTTDIVVLLNRWSSEPDTIGRLLARPEWLIDGWDRICALWHTAEQHLGREKTMAEMAGLVPAIPAEAGTWIGQRFDVEGDMQRHRRKVTAMQDWRSGVTIGDLIARNENIIAEIE